MHRRWKCIGIVLIWGCMAGCPRVAGLVGENPNLLAAFGGAAPNAAAGGLNAAGGAGGVPNFVVPFQQGPVPAQPGVIAGSGGP